MTISEARVSKGARLLWQGVWGGQRHPQDAPGGKENPTDRKQEQSTPKGGGAAAEQRASVPRGRKPAAGNRKNEAVSHAAKSAAKFLEM